MARAALATYAIEIEYTAKIQKTINWQHSIGKFLTFKSNRRVLLKNRI